MVRAVFNTHQQSHETIKKLENWKKLKKMAWQMFYILILEIFLLILKIYILPTFQITPQSVENKLFS